jgi:DNA-binding beta-propeller fold protein YncE
VIDTKTNEIVSTITTGKSPYGMAFDSMGELMFIANYCSKTMSVFDLKNNRILSTQLSVGGDKGNPMDVGVYEDKDGNIRVFVAKEAYPQRVPCNDGTKNTGLNVSIFTIYKPKNR